MSEKQILNEIYYKKSVQFLKRLFRKGMINEEQFKQINSLNRQTFCPGLQWIYD